MNRYGISDRPGASIVNAVLRDYEILNNNHRDICGPSKLRRERERRGKDAAENNMIQNMPILGLYYDAVAGLARRHWWGPIDVNKLSILGAQNFFPG